MIIENITAPGAEPTDGDWVRITYGNGSVEHKHWTSPVETQAPTKRTITQLEFLRLCQSAGGATQQMIVSAKKDLNLEYMWLMFEMANGIAADDKDTVTGLSALEMLGYLPNGVQSVLDEWPV